jgi:hypothetical protein
MNDGLDIIALLAIALGLAGLLVAVTAPGNPASAMLPIGIGLWWVVGFFARRCSSPQNSK